jgi:hypothetical protein
MPTHEIIIDGETYTVTEDEFGHIITELKMTDEQKAIIVAEQAAVQAIVTAKNQAFIDNLPSWSAVDTAVTNIANLTDAKAFIRKLARVVYWLARNSAT